MMSIRFPFCMVLPIVAAAMTLASQPIHAQPQTPAPKVAAPPNAKEQMTQMQAQMERFMKMTPAEMRRMTLDLQKQHIQTFFTAAGFNDLELQDTLWQFVLTQEEARGELRVAATKLREMAADTKVDEAVITKQQALYQQTLDAEKARRTDAVRELGEALRLGTRPRLQVLLSLLGYTDDAVWLIGDTSLMGTMMMGTAQMAVMAQPKAAAEKAAPAAPIAPPVER